MENYSRIFEKKLAEIENVGVRPRLLLHACCAPCSSYVVEYISRYFDITMYFFNPNISPRTEFDFRLSELKRFLAESGHSDIAVCGTEYDPSVFFDSVRGFEDLPEGGERCRICYGLRMRRTAEAAKEGGFDCFTTTLSISPHKNAVWLNEIGLALADEYGIEYLCSDFKKKNGYKRSIELSAQYSLYRQDYCGCIFSKNQRDIRQGSAK